MYVTLEPCAHHGRTPPCTEAIIAAGVKRVVIGIGDPAAHVAGRGIAALRRGGVEVVVANDARCRALHEHYLHHLEYGRPFVTLKSATSFDGKIATPSGNSKWITSEASRRWGHRLRAGHHAVAVGVETVLADDPRLDVRLTRGVDPLRVVFDSRLRIAREKRALHVVAEGTWVVHTKAASQRARAQLQRAGLTLLEVGSDRAGRVRVDAALRALGRREIRSLLVEGGGTLVGSFVAAHAWQRWFWFQAPLIVGEGRGAVAGLTHRTIAAASAVEVERRRRVGVDWLSVLRPQRDDP